MPDAFDKLAFETAQMARIGWFFGQKLLAARFAKPLPVPEKLRGRETPDRQRLIRDLWQLIEHDWQHIAKRAFTPRRMTGAATRSTGCAAPPISLPTSARSRRAAMATRVSV